jgi:hypothetical protein
VVVEPQRAARRRVVAARGGAFHDESVDPAVRLALEHARQRCRGDDREKARPLQARDVVAADRARVEVRPGLAAEDRDRKLGRLALGVAVEDAGDELGDPGAHQDVVDPRQHRAEQRRGVGDRDLLQVVDPDGALVALLREEDLDEVGGDDQLAEVGARVQRRDRAGAERLAGGLAALDEVPVEDPGGDVLVGKRCQGPAHRAAGVAQLEPARDDRVDGRARDDTEVAGRRDGVGEAPRGYAGPHASLDD